MKAEVNASDERDHLLLRGTTVSGTVHSGREVLKQAKTSQKKGGGEG